MTKRAILLIIITGLILPLFRNIRAQDFTFSQFYANPLYLNPAMVGIEYCPRITLNYRNQWASLPGAFVSYSAAYDQYSDFLHGGLGLQVNYDKSGEATIQQASINGMYAYQVTVSEAVTAQLAVQAGYWQKSINGNDIILPSQIDTLTGSVSSSNLSSGLVRRIDFASGFLVGIDEKYFFGGAVHHLTQPDISFLNEGDTLKMKFTIHAGANFNQQPQRGGRYSNPGLGISPNILYQQQGNFRHLNVGSYFTLHPFSAGIWYRHAFANPDAIVVSLGFQTQNLRAGYSYDYTVSQFSNASGGSHEISLAWVFDCDKKRKYRGAIKCPTF